MAVQIVEKDKRPAKGKGEDNLLITLSAKQVDCYQADPTDFDILESADGVNAEVAGHGQHGNNKSEHRKLLQKAAADKGKSAFKQSK